jgi:hypothetical protein
MMATTIMISTRVKPDWGFILLCIRCFFFLTRRERRKRRVILIITNLPTNCLLQTATDQLSSTRAGSNPLRCLNPKSEIETGNLPQSLGHKRFEKISTGHFGYASIFSIRFCSKTLRHLAGLNFGFRVKSGLAAQKRPGIASGPGAG